MRFFKITLLFIGLFIVQSSYAAEFPPFYFGVSAGQTHIEQGVDGSYDVANTLTLSSGLIFSDSTSFETSIEASYSQTIKKENVTLSGSNNEYEEETLGLFIATRTKSDFYVKAKLGLVDNRITTNTVVTYDAVKVSAGIGFGIKDESGGVTEIEYIVIDDNINLLTIGYLF